MMTAVSTTNSRKASNRSDILEPVSRLPTVDVLVSMYNEGAYIRRCLERGLAQDYPADLLAVWLIDGGSTDQTVSIAREFAQKDARIRILATGERLNLPEALNMGIDRACPWVRESCVSSVP